MQNITIVGAGLVGTLLSVYLFICCYHYSRTFTVWVVNCVDTSCIDIGVLVNILGNDLQILLCGQVSVLFHLACNFHGASLYSHCSTKLVHIQRNNSRKQATWVN